MFTDTHSETGPLKPPLQPDKWFRDRRACVLLHPSALPGPGGGRLGRPAHQFVDFLAKAGVGVWQTLPLGPVNESLSPYQPLSMLAGNPEMINPELLAADGLLPDDADMHRPVRELCRAAYETLQSAGLHALGNKFAEFRERERDWLEYHALFLVLDRRFREPDWTAWPAPLRHRDGRAMKNARKEFAGEIAFESFLQWQFHRQWSHLRHHANLAGVRIFGDLPIYPALHSADVWLEPELFQLDESGQPRFVSGTPPDAFTDTGQMWGTPIYAWDQHAAQGFRWWVRRMRARLRRFDLLRIDHFRGLAACWAIPAAAESAAEGAWQSVPGTMLLQTLADELPDLELVAEDLGHITEDVHALRDAFGLPGMRVLQFGFDGSHDNPHLPERVGEWSVYYTGTHDNNTLLGWWLQLDSIERQRVSDTLGNFDAAELPWPLLRTVFASQAGLAVAPLQDFLGLGAEARFNIPGTIKGNWRWQINKLPDTTLAHRIRKFLRDCGRTS